VRGPISQLRQELNHWLGAFPYAVIVPTAIGGEGVRLCFAAPEKPDVVLLKQLVCDLHLKTADLSFDDPARGQVSRILRNGNQINAFLLTGDVRAQEALLLWADSGVAPEPISHALLGRGAVPVRPRIVCTCESVTDQALEHAIAAGDGLPQLKANLK